MLKKRVILAAMLLPVAGCGTAQGSAEVPPPAAKPIAPTGATVGQSGFVTVLDAPPAPFTARPSATPPQPTPDQRAAQEQFRRAGEFQNRVMAEVQALGDRLRRQERGNFVDLYFENEGDPHVVFRFLREPERSLARYSRNPAFRAARAEFTNEQLVDAMDFMLETFRDDRVILGGGTGNKENRAVIDIAVTEPEFRALVARKGVTIPDGVQLNFVTETPASAVNRPLPPGIGPMIRIFPRDDRPTGPVHDINSRLKPVLRDGCFRIAGGENDGALLLFPLGESLFVDGEGYLAFGNDGEPGHARVGEDSIFHGSPGEVTAPELVDPIHQACGSGKVIKVNHLTSAAADGARTRVETNARALQEFRESYGLPEDQAKRLLEACKRHVGGPICITSPPPPVARQEDCPAGTTLSYGLCRTPEGYIRPMPKWLQELLT